MNEHLEDVKVNLTFTHISPGAEPNDQATLKVPSVKFQSSAMVGTSLTITPVTTPALVSGASMNPTARPFFFQRGSPLKKKSIKKSTKSSLIISYHMIQALWKVQG